jgi:hypothetical protein
MNRVFPFQKGINITSAIYTQPEEILQAHYGTPWLSPQNLLDLSHIDRCRISRKADVKVSHVMDESRGPKGFHWQEWRCA